MPCHQFSVVTPPHVVIVEDDEGIRDVLEMLFSEDGFLVTICASLDSAHAAMREEPMHLLISDMRLGNSVRGGLELVRAVRQRHPPAVEAILLTGVQPSTIAAEIQTLDALGGHLMGKPFDIDALLELARALTGWPGKLGH